MISGKASDRPSSEVSPISRMPGLSIKSIPFPREMRVRTVVVCLPLSSDVRTAPVRAMGLPAIALMSVDLPAPLEPRRQKVAGPRKIAISSPRPRLSVSLHTMTGNPGAHAMVWSTFSLISSGSARSALLRTMIPLAPEAAMMVV